MIIGIDFDETLFPTLEKVLDIYNKQHEESLLPSQITTHNFYECLDSIIADKLLDIFLYKEVYNNLQPFKGAVRAVQTLINNGHEVYIATATSVINLEWKEQLLQKYFPFIPKNNLIRIHNKSLLNVDVLIEDNIDNLTQIFADRICFDQPWNRSDNKDFAYDIYRVYSWHEIVNTINEIERKHREWETQ